ncbi:MAG: glycosyltransferase family 2 protein [Jatrophihabitantaceae bacterium]|nr:glycosyltransferase family 2 protein [Jatrophihabitantaceae bacterium]
MTGRDITVVVVTWRGREHIARCLDSLRAQTLPHRVLVIDNASDDGTAGILGRYPEVRVVRLPANAGFAGGVATALSAVSTSRIALLNDDADADPAWLAELGRVLDDDPGLVAVTSWILLRDGRTNSLGVALTPDGHGFDLGFGERPAISPEARDVFGFCGGAAMLRTQAVAAVGGFPAEFFLYYEDTDTSWRLRLAGGRIGVVPSAVVHHSHGASSDVRSAAFAQWTEGNRLRMLARCAPATVAGRAFAAHLAVSVRLMLRRARRGTPAEHNLRFALRLRVWATVVAELPRLVRARRAQGVTRAQRRAVWDQWAGAT